MAGGEEQRAENRKWKRSQDDEERTSEQNSFQNFVCEKTTSEYLRFLTKTTDFSKSVIYYVLPPLQ